MTDENDARTLYAERDRLLTEHASIRRRLYEVESALDRINSKRFMEIQDAYWSHKKQEMAKR